MARDPLTTQNAPRTLRDKETPMIDVKTADRELQTYIRPQTFPVAIRMLRPGEPIPERARRPARDFKKLTMSCQVIDMARRYGWTIALTREDHICSLGITAIGFDKPLPIYNVGTLCEGMYTETKEAGQRSEAAIDKFAPGEYARLLVAPLDRATFEPHLVCVYANPAQVMRLTQAALWKRGGRLDSSFEGRAVCADIIVTTMQTGEPQVILPCSGDRIFGQTQDHEMAFTIPWARMEEIVEGLRGTHNGGIRYPITQFMEYEAKLPPRYMEVNRLWDAEKGKTSLTNRDRVVAAYKRSFSDRVPVYPIVASFAGTLDGQSIEEYCTNPDQGHHRDDELLRALPARRGARLQRSRQGGGGLRLPASSTPTTSCPPSRRTCSRTRRDLAKLRDARSLQDRAASRLPRAVRGPREGGAARRHRRGGGRAVDDRDAAPQPGDDAARHLRGPAVHPRRDAASRPTSASSGATPS